ncbi:TPA: hypothetical protein U2R27_002727 [Enterococcus faecium]|nr:hypothetical protein [Enterococcus faecium]
MRYSPAGISKKFSQIVSEVLTQIHFAPNGPGWTMNIGIYYTYNPVAGTYYVVQNI